MIAWLTIKQWHGPDLIGESCDYGLVLNLCFTEFQAQAQRAEFSIGVEIERLPRYEHYHIENPLKGDIKTLEQFAQYTEWRKAVHNHLFPQEEQ